jgi:ribosome-associated protein
MEKPAPLGRRHLPGRNCGAGQDRIKFIFRIQHEVLLTNQITADALSFDQLRQLVVAALEDFKAIDIQLVDVSGRNPLTELLVVASGRSSRHVKAMADQLIMQAKASGCQPLGVEGQRNAEWILVDLNDVIVHLMLPRTRAFYNLEKLWDASSDRRSSASQPGAF